ncbi:MAG: restriction endonuclease [Kofleriaceae bacterium]
MTKQKTADDTEESGARKRSPTKKAAAKKPAAKKPAAKKPAPKKPAAKKPVEKVAAAVVVLVEDEIEDAEVIAETPIEVMQARGDADDDDDDDDDDDAEPETHAAPEPVATPAMTEEEQELSAIYGTDLDAPATAHAEYQDRQTRDEDRPMLPEINARDERKSHWQDRRRNRREQRDRERQERRDRPPAQNQQQNQQPRPQQQQDQRPPQHAQQRLPLPTAAPIAATNNGQADHDALARVGTPLGDAAATVFAQLRNGQPLPLRQLAAMMRKRNLVEVDPDQLAPQLKAELLGDERSYRTLGLRPRIVYRGRDLFAPGPVAMSVTAEAEAGFAASLSRLAGATHRALAQRISKASPAGFERLIHAYLVAAGYRDIAWVKRLGGISYASATAPGIDRTILLSARSGDQPIDRRGIGELRVGVEAKNLVAGILFSARELSEDAEKELERSGRSVAVVCGDQLVAALIASGVGVVSAAAPLRYVDDQLLDELLAG